MSPQNRLRRHPLTEGIQNISDTNLKHINSSGDCSHELPLPFAPDGSAKWRQNLISQQSRQQLPIVEFRHVLDVHLSTDVLRRWSNPVELLPQPDARPPFPDKGGRVAMSAAHGPAPCTARSL